MGFNSGFKGLIYYSTNLKSCARGWGTVFCQMIISISTVASAEAKAFKYSFSVAAKPRCSIRLCFTYFFSNRNLLYLSLLFSQDRTRFIFISVPSLILRLRCFVAWLPTFRDNLSVPSSRLSRNVGS